MVKAVHSASQEEEEPGGGRGHVVITGCDKIVIHSRFLFAGGASSFSAAHATIRNLCHTNGMESPSRQWTVEIITFNYR